MTASLPAEAVRSYREHGYCFPIRVLDEAEADGCFARMQDFAARHPDEAPTAFGPKCQLLFPWLYDLAAHPRILDAVESIVGPDILCWAAGFFNKQARDPAIVTWHQDSTYWGLEPMDIVTAWVAFTPSRVESGCMRVVPGTHTLDQLPHVDTFAENNLLTRGQEIAVEVDEDRAVDVELEPGEMSLHHVRIVHGSGPNGSDTPRFGFAIRYIPTHVRQRGGRTTAQLVRGVDRYGHFDPEPRPEADFDDAARAFHAEAAARVEAVLYATADEPGHRRDLEAPAS